MDEDPSQCLLHPPQLSWSRKLTMSMYSCAAIGKVRSVCNVRGLFKIGESFLGNVSGHLR